MTLSIEQIWQQASEQQDPLQIPQVKNLYQRRSENLVDKIEQLFELNKRALIWASGIMFTVFLALNLPIVAIIIPACLMYLVKHSSGDIKEFSALDKTANSYQYIAGFYELLQNKLTKYGQLYRWIYPILLASALIQLAYSEIGQVGINSWIEASPSLLLVLNVPVLAWLVIIVLCSLVSWFAPKIYALDVQAFYGRQFEKLDQIVSDLEALRAKVD